MQHKKIFCIFLALVMFTMCFAGCAAGSGASTKPAASTTGEAASAQSEPVTLTIGGWGYNDFFLPVLQREFSKKYSDITLEYERMEHDDYVNKLKVNLSVGTAWDIMMVESGSLLNATKDYFLPLNDMCKTAWGDNWQDKFNGAVLERVMEPDGTAYGLPDAMGLAGMLLYNKTKLEQHNLSVPKTYEELKAYTDLLRTEGDLPLVIGGKDTWIITDIFTVIANDIAPGKLVQADKGEIPWTDPELMKAFEAWQRMFTDGIFQDGSLGLPQYPGTTELFWQNGQGGMVAEGDWSIATFTDSNMAPIANKDEYTLACMPDMNGDGKVAGPVFSTGLVYVINKDIAPEKKQAAYDYVRWIVGEEGPSVMNGPEIGTANTPAFKDIVIERTSEYSNYVNCMNEVAELTKQVSGPRDLMNVDAKTALGEVLQELGIGLSPEAAAERIQAVMG